MVDYRDMSHAELLEIINEVREKIKSSEVLQDLCEEHDVDVDYIDLIPMAFTDLDVSARTDKGCIYYNFKLLDDDDFLRDDHYMIHEITHHFQQCFGDGPTQGAAEGEYLDNKYEQEGFQLQTEYLSETRGDKAAEDYVEKVFEHHDVPEKERSRRKKDLLNLANLVNSLSK